MKIGFTGTQAGLTHLQLEQLNDYIEDLRPEDIREAHHGCCIGADAQFHQTCLSFLLPIFGHPCTIFSKQMPIATTEFESLRRVLPPLERNKNIVRAVDVLIVGPRGPEILRSGTWSTYRFAKKIGVATHVLRGWNK